MELTLELRALLVAAYAMLLGGVIGFERELKNRPAGFRTHTLVAGAAALLMALSQLPMWVEPALSPITLRADPLRLVEAVIAGVSFIGAGTIFARRQEDHVAGITTAASLLMVAVIGLLVGLHHFVLATAATALTLGVLIMLSYIERRTGLRERGEQTKAPPGPSAD